MGFSSIEITFSQDEMDFDQPAKICLAGKIRRDLSLFFRRCLETRP
jgi:hypothetical protein